MSTIRRLPKWVSLLLTLLMGVLTTFSVQFFIAGAVPLPAYIVGAVPLSRSNASGAIKICTIVNGAAKSTEISIRIGASVDSSLSTALVTNQSGSAKSKVQYHLMNCH